MIRPAGDELLLQSDWNAVASVRQEFRKAVDFLRDLGLGPVGRTPYLNVLTLKVDDRRRLLDLLRERWDEHARALIARVAPAEYAFNFRSVDEFRLKSAAVVEILAPLMAGKRFHVRIHRRGFKEKLRSPEENERLAGVVLDVLARAGATAHVGFEDPDVVLAVETVGNRAGLALWTREDLARYPFLRPD